MHQKSPFVTLSLWIALAFVVLAIILGILAFNAKLAFIYVNLNFTEVHHLFSWTGAGFIAIYTPLFYYLKKRVPGGYKSLIQVHVFGNLISFVLITIHFAHHLREFAEIIPHPSTGAPLYTSVVLLVITGIAMRYRLAKKFYKPFRSLHIGLMMALYLIVVFHILVGQRVF